VLAVPGKTMPMFPLGMVLFPHAVFPLRVFEPRYRELTEVCLRSDGRFGVVLIERGSEVGGGDTRFSVGTVARIAEAARTPDGRYLLATVGTERFRVRKWLPDDPYPRAEIDLLSEPKRIDDRASRLRAEVEPLLRRVLALGAELGYRAPPVDAVRLDDDPVRASFEAASLAPVGPLDAQRLLEVDDPSERFEALATLLADTEEMFRLRLGGG
jgi:Lon protease-like protein